MPARTTETETETNVRSIVYRASTICAAVAVGGAGAVDLLHIPAVMEALAHLGYPTYFASILGTWELLGAVAILAPRRSLVKEWAFTRHGLRPEAAPHCHTRHWAIPYERFSSR